MRTYSSIVIRVTDGQATAALPAFSVAVAPAVTTNPSPTNTPPTISGNPLTSVVQGIVYSFRPTASDANGNTLTFAASGLPSWLTLDTATGRISGTPTGANVGPSGNIVISVSDGLASASLPPFSITVVGVATGSATLSWTPPTQNSDGSPLTNLAGYKVYWGTSEDDYSNTGHSEQSGAHFIRRRAADAGHLVLRDDVGECCGGRKWLFERGVEDGAVASTGRNPPANRGARLQG